MDLVGRGESLESGPAASTEDSWVLRLYIAGRTEKSVMALENLRRICEQHLAGSYRVEVIDLLEVPQRAKDEQVLAVPTVVRRLPLPMKKIVGDLSDAERVREALDLRPASAIEERQ